MLVFGVQDSWPNQIALLSYTGQVEIPAKMPPNLSKVTSPGTQAGPTHKTVPINCKLGLENLPSIASLTVGATLTYISSRLGNGAKSLALIVLNFPLETALCVCVCVGGAEKGKTSDAGCGSSSTPAANQNFTGKCPSLPIAPT